MHGVPARRQSQAGFTLTELLVATAIFVILMSALVTLFSSAIAAVRQGYASIDAYDTGRMAMTTFSRDLSGAFTAREHGDTYNFYGRPDGFMFVGALANGQIGRVTYVMHPSVGTPTVRMKVTERWGVVEANIRRQVERIARQRGYNGATVTSYSDGTIDVVDDYYEYSDFSITRRYYADEWVEFDVELELESLVRYEETGAGDLDTFDMYVKLDSGGVPIQLDWPYVDPSDYGNDATPLAGDGDTQQQFLLGALDPNPSDPLGTFDMRNRFRSINTGGGVTHPSGDQLYLRALGRDTFDQMLKARKREFWLRMLSGESMGLPSLTSDASYGSVGYWHDERLNAPNDRKMRKLNEYLIADGIVARTRLLQPDSDNYVFVDLAPGGPIPGPEDILPDILDAEVMFSYGDGGLAPVNYFNDIENLRNPDDPHSAGGGPVNVPTLLAQGAAGFTDVDLIEADKALADTLLGNRSNRKNLGSPLAPRIPSVVTTDFWVTRTRTRPGAPDILKRFSQTVQIPTAQGRSVSTTIAQGPGASL